MYKQPQILLVILALLAMALSACQPVSAQPIQSMEMDMHMEPSSGMKVIDTVPLKEFTDPTQVIEGSRSTLIRTDEGVDLVMDTTGLAPNEAHTIWWVVFNNPEHCAAEMCVGPDIENPDVATMVGYATGAVSDENGNAHFVATLRVGDASMAIDNTSGFPWQLVEPSPGLIDPYKAQIHAVPRTHGAVLDDAYAQLTTFTADCNPECFNVQASVHYPPILHDPRADTVTLKEFTDPTVEIAGSQSTLIRTDEGIDLVMDTTGLAPNEAHTIWWVVFNNPEHCAAEMCVGPDIENPDVATMVGYATGAVSDENGNAHFVATLRVGDASMAIDNTSGFPWQLVEPSPGLIDPYKAQIHAVPRTHGAVLDDAYAQLTTFTADCNPECFNVQAAVHYSMER